MDKVCKYCLDEQGRTTQVTLAGCPALPVYAFEYKGASVTVECRGEYDNWQDLPQAVSDYVNTFDKPDVVLYDARNQRMVAAAEFTETVSVGNSQWQRSGRAVAAAMMKVPFLAVYPSAAEDRSQDTIREPTALLTEFFLILALQDRTNPALLLLRDDPYLSSLNSERCKNRLPVIERPSGDDLVGKWFGLRLLSILDESVRQELAPIEECIFDWMFRTLEDQVSVKTGAIARVENDLPHWKAVLGYPMNIHQLRQHFLGDISLTKWTGVHGGVASKSYFHQVVEPRLLQTTTNDIMTYVEGGKHCIIRPDHTQKVEAELRELYPPHEEFPWPLGHLDQELPCALIPFQGWQRQGKTLSDPNCGEAVAFAAMFRTLQTEKANVVFIIYGTPHPKWLDQYKQSIRGEPTNKLMRTVRALGDVLCLDNSGTPVSIAVT